jgi:hypothetical protein
MPRGKRQPIIIANRYFNSKKEATAFISNMLSSLPRNERLGEPHDSFLRDLVSMHPRAEEKTQGEISYFSVGADSYNGRCFYLHRPDGTKTDFGSKKCLDGERRDNLVFGAMRTAVMDQTQEFRQSQFDRGPVRCPFKGVVLNLSNVHVDHTPPRTFYKLVQEWLAVSGLPLADVAISESEDNQMFRQMTDPRQRVSWCQFHRSNATLRLTSKLANLSDSKIEGNSL